MRFQLPKPIALLTILVFAAVELGTLDLYAQESGDAAAQPGETEVEATDESANAETAQSPPVIDRVWYSPQKPKVWSIVSLGVSAQNADVIEIDFGSGYYRSYNHIYLSFGAKTITVRASNVAGSTETSIRLEVIGNFTIIPKETKVQHDASGNPVTSAEIKGFGTFDVVRVYREMSEVLTIQGNQRDVDIPVPFVGTEKFGVLLYDRGNPVTFPEVISMTGLNTPPGKPFYDGSALLRSTPGQAIEFTVSANDPNNDRLRFEARGLPENAELDSSTGAFSWTPSANQLGSWLVTFLAFDVPYDTRTSFVQRTFVITR